jgi:hypothetical protein
MNEIPEGWRAKLLDSWEVELRIGERDGLRILSAEVSSEVLEELCQEYGGDLGIRRYAWEVRISTLANGERRYAWDESGDEDDLEGDLPGASLCLPVSALASPLSVRFEGQLTIDDDTIVWDQELVPGVVALVRRSVAYAPLEWPPSREVAPLTTTIPDVPARANIVATLPEIGLVERLKDGYRLHTPSGSVAIQGLDGVLDRLPGREDRRRHAGGARGRLAIYSTRRDPYVAYVVIVEVDTQGVIRVIHTSDAFACERGCFDATGTLYVGSSRATLTNIDANTTRYDWRTVVFDCDTVQLCTGWSAAPLLQESRCHIDREMLAFAHDSALRRAPAGQRDSESWLWLPYGSEYAYHPTPELAAALDRRWSLHLFHPTRGARQIAIPGATGPLAVLRDGRVLVVGDRIWVFDEEGVIDLGELHGFTERLEIVEADAITLWTTDPKRWRIVIPPP